MTEYEYHKEVIGLLEEIECTKDDIKYISKLDTEKVIEVSDIPIPLSEGIKDEFIASLKHKIAVCCEKLDALKE